MQISNLTGAGNMTNRARVEKILNHLEYSAEMIAEILAKFPNRKEKEQKEEESDMEEGMECQRGEAEMLNDLLNKLLEKPGNVEKKEPKDQKDSGGKMWEPLKEKPEKDQVELPPGCRLHVGLPNSASPFVQGTLPEGETYKGFKSHSRSFNPDGSKGSKGGSSSSSSAKQRALLTQSAATAQVVAWLWAWYDSTPERAAKKRRT